MPRLWVRSRVWVHMEGNQLIFLSLLLSLEAMKKCPPLSVKKIKKERKEKCHVPEVEIFHFVLCMETGSSYWVAELCSQNARCDST